MPYNILVTTCLDFSSWICFSKRNFCSSDASHILLRRGSVVEIAEDDIEVDSLSLEAQKLFIRFLALQIQGLSGES